MPEDSSIDILLTNQQLESVQSTVEISNENLVSNLEDMFQSTSETNFERCSGNEGSWIKNDRITDSTDDN